MRDDEGRTEQILTMPFHAVHAKSENFFHPPENALERHIQKDVLARLQSIRGLHALYAEGADRNRGTPLSSV